MRKFNRVSAKLDPEVVTLLKQYFDALNRFRLGEDIQEAQTQLVNVGIFGEMESLEPFIAFVHNRDFQIA